MNLVSNVWRNKKICNTNLRFQNQNRTVAYFFHADSGLRRQMALMLSQTSNHNISCIFIQCTSPRYSLVIMEYRCLRMAIHFTNKCVPLIGGIFVIRINMAKCTSQSNIISREIECCRNTTFTGIRTITNFRNGTEGQPSMDITISYQDRITLISGIANTDKVE